MPTTTVSFRVDAELLAELDALTRQNRQDRSAVLLELVRIGLGVKRGAAEDRTISALAGLTGEVRRLRAKVGKGQRSGELTRELEEVARKLLDAVADQQGRATDLVIQELATLRQHVRRSFGNYLRIGFKLSEEEAKQRVKETFDT